MAQLVTVEEAVPIPDESRAYADGQSMSVETLKEPPVEVEAAKRDGGDAQQWIAQPPWIRAFGFGVFRGKLSGARNWGACGL